MDIRKRKLKGYIALSILIIMCLIMASAMIFFMQYNKGKIYNENITPLASVEPVINGVEIESLSSAKYISPSSLYANSSAANYSKLTGSLPITTGAGNTLSLVTENNTHPKYTFFDFNTKVAVPSYTKYTVDYKITFTVNKTASSGNTSTVYHSLYDYGIDYTEDSPDSDKINGVKRYQNEGDYEILPTGDYFVHRIQTATCNSTESFTYEFTTIHDNKTNKTKDFFHNYSCYVFGWTGIGSPKTYSMSGTVQVTADIEAKPTTIADPEDVEIPYTGEDLSLADISDEKKEWYDSYAMKLEYPADMKNAGPHTVPVSIIQSLKDYGVKFENSGGTEQSFTFKITKKKISATITKAEGGEGYVAKAITGEVYSGDTGERAPTFGVTYISTDGKGYDSDTYPSDKVGKFKAVAKITNDCNYVLDEKRADEYTYEFEKTKTEVTKPTKPLSNLTYNGQEQEFELLNISDIDKVTITPKTSGLTDVGNGKLKAKNAGKYYVTVSLKDNGKATKWKNTTDDIDSYDIELT
ncbi:MAG: hypothetical protein K2J13_00495, partial [Clostridia bacterium]|nr:hypothetical protein [Clostridia bacterium]